LYNNFRRIITEKGITPYRVAKDTGVSNTTLSDWKNGKSTPKLDKLIKISKYLGVDLKDLITVGEAKHGRKNNREESGRIDRTFTANNPGRD